MRRHVRVGLLGFAAAVLLACGDDLGPRVPAAIVVMPEAPTVLAGGTLQLAATVVDATGQEISGQAVAFRSSNTDILTVDDTGLLTSLGPAGSSVITATSGDITADVEATAVSPSLPPSTILVDPASLVLDTHQSSWLSFTVTDASGQPVPGAPIAFQGSDPAIVHISPDLHGQGPALVTGLGVGTATITLTSGELSTQVPVTVGRFPTSVGITPSYLSLPAGGSHQLEAALLDLTEEEIEGPHSVTWSSSDDAVVAVGANGIATALASEGSARITATIDTFSASISVLVGRSVGEMLERLPIAEGQGVAVAADGRYFVAGSGILASGALPDFAFSAELAIDGTLVDVALNAGGTRAYVVRESGGAEGPGVAVVDLTTNSLVDFIPVHAESPQTAALSADGSVLTVGTGNGLVVIDLATKSSTEIAVGRIRKITRHPTRPLLYASGPGVLELDDSSGEIIRTFQGDSWSHAVSPDGTRLYIVGIDGGTAVWNLETGVREPGLPAYGDDVAITPDGKFLYVIQYSRLFIHDRASGIRVREVVLDGLAQRIAMSSDGIALITSASHTVGPDDWVDFVR